MNDLQNPSSRHYELDWLRIIAIVILLFYHVGMAFVSWSWHIKNQETSTLLEDIMVWFHQWRMPLLLFISGAATYFALGKKSTKKYLSDRVKRLLVPLVFGFFVIVPPQIYYEKISLYSSFWDFYPTVYHFIPYPKGSFSWHHLWFIAYLLIFSVIALPLFVFLRKEKSKKLFDLMVKFFSKPGALLTLALPILLSQIILRPFFPEETHDLIHDWAYFTFYFSFFLFGYLLCCDIRLWEIIKEQRTLNILMALLTLIPFYIIWFIDGDWSNTLRITYSILKIFIAWFWVIALVGYGQKYLNFENPILIYSSEATYPFYILHQSVIIAIGYYVIQWQLNLWVKYSIITILTFSFCMGLYHLVIKRFNLTRVLFGMKPLNFLKSKELIKDPKASSLNIALD
ncbi:MAG: acyltransferase family protein [Acidobacteria bacterium]|nr:acyltransferase family protein [Acidobacteriota bacterium]